MYRHMIGGYSPSGWHPDPHSVLNLSPTGDCQKSRGHKNVDLYNPLEHNFGSVDLWAEKPRVNLNHICASLGVFYTKPTLTIWARPALTT